jgi:vacuolar-type H+-ATPase subunit I/STV1
MKRLIVVGLVGVILFGVSAGISWYVVLPRLAETTEEEPEQDKTLVDGPPAMPGNIDENDKLDAMPVALRPEIPVTVEAVTELAQSIMKKEGSLIESEKRLKKEEKRIGLLFEDLKQERDELTAFSQRVDAKVLEAREAVELLKMESQTLLDQKNALSALEKKTGKTSDDVQEDELDGRVEILKGWFAKLDPEVAASYLKEFANQGDLKLAAKLIDSLEERQIAKILAVLNDPPLVAQIVEAFTKNKEVGRQALQSQLR